MEKIIASDGTKYDFYGMGHLEPTHNDGRYLFWAGTVEEALEASGWLMESTAENAGWKFNVYAAKVEDGGAAGGDYGWAYGRTHKELLEDIEESVG